MSWLPSPFVRLWLVLALWSGFVGRYAVGAEAEAAQPPVDFAKEVQPLLKQRCWRCHGGEHQEGGLRLNERKSALAGGDSGKPAIVPGKPDDSRLLRAVSGREPI